jgi:hypothetical protein
MTGIDMTFTRHPCPRPRCGYDGGYHGHRLLVPDGDPPGQRTAVCRACGRIYPIPIGAHAPKG